MWVWGDCDRSWAGRGPQGLLELAARAPEIDEAFLRAIEETVVPADPMIVIYSSGSTADPKGAIHSHGAVLRHSLNLCQFRDLRADDRIFSPMPFFWVGGFVFTLMAAMHSGAFMICEEAFEWLDAPIRRVTALDTPVPFSPPLEEYYLPQTDDIVNAARWILAY